jgi:hypothetical protein
MDEKRYRVDFNNSDQRLQIWMTEDELIRMLTKEDVWERKAWQSDLDKMQRRLAVHEIWLLLFTVIIVCLAVAIWILFCGGR